MLLISFFIFASQAGLSICYGYTAGIIKSDGEMGTCKYYYLQDLVGNALNIIKDVQYSVGQLSTYLPFSQNVDADVQSHHHM